MDKDELDDQEWMDGYDCLEMIDVNGWMNIDGSIYVDEDWWWRYMNGFWWVKMDRWKRMGWYGWMNMDENRW